MSGFVRFSARVRAPLAPVPEGIHEFLDRGQAHVLISRPLVGRHGGGALLPQLLDAVAALLRVYGGAPYARHRDQSQFSRYFYPWSVVGWIRLAEEDEWEDPAAARFQAPR
jgi:hypothetical protein